MSIWFTADWHLNHKNIIKYCKRPFDSVEEMDNTIINNFWSTVKIGDTVYYLGDFGFFKRGIPDYVTKFFKDISKNCIQMHFIKGSHDKFIGMKITNTAIMLNPLQSISNMKDINIQRQEITLCHYPMISFNHSHFDAWQLYGHHHWDTSKKIGGKRMNVGVDIHNFYPVSFWEVKEFMGNRKSNWNTVT